MTILKTIKSGLLFVLLLAVQAVYCQTANFVPGEILVKMKPSAKAQKVSLKTQMAANTLKSYPAIGIELWQLQEADSEAATLQFVEEVKNHPDVEFAEPNYLWQAVDACDDPNDSMASQLYGMNIINAPEAWCIGTGSPSVVVGILDTGIDWTHEDLADNIWQNLGEDADGDGVVLIQDADGKWIFDPGDEIFLTKPPKFLRLISLQIKRFTKSNNK